METVPCLVEDLENGRAVVIDIRRHHEYVGYSRLRVPLSILLGQQLANMGMESFNFANF